jgi:Spx/MgsR family transcriptional regulator
MRLYGLKKCGTCQKALNWLDEHGIAHDFIDYRDHPLSADTLKVYADKLGGWEKLVNRASMTWRKLAEHERQASTDQQWQALIAQYPSLIKRPLTVHADGSVTTGFNENKFKEKLNDRE